MPFIWIAVAIIALIVEGLTLSLVAVWFVPGAAVSLIFSLFDAKLWIQVVVFFFVSAVCVIMVKTIFKKYFKVGTEKTNTDLIIGKQAVVIEKIDDIAATGQVKVKGQVWSAKSGSAETFEPGEIVNVVAIEGVKLVCNK